MVVMWPRNKQKEKKKGAASSKSARPSEITDGHNEEMKVI